MSQLRKDPIIDRWVIVATKRAKRPNDFEANGSKNHLSGQIDQSCQIAKDRQKREKIIFDESFQQAKEFGFHQIVNDSYCRKLDLSCNFYPVFSLYKEKILEIKKEKDIKYVIIFRNYKVETNSKSLRHNNCNFIGLPVYPKNVKREIGGALNYYKKNKSCIYCDIIAQEKEIKERFVLENNSFVAINPFASRFPLETWILPKKHSHDYSQSSSEQLKDLSKAFKEILLKMKNLLGDFSYTYVLHTGPLEDSPADDTLRSYHWYIEIIPLLTRVAGFEWGTGFYINPIPPEFAAESLRETQIKQMSQFNQKK
jgi:UDPglucose--hexose-1-phosphate uridylyltransferase